MSAARSRIAVTAAMLALSLLSPAPAQAFKTAEEAKAFYDAQTSREGAVHWATLDELERRVVTTGPSQTWEEVELSGRVKALVDQKVRLVGYIYPIEPGERHQRFLLSAYPPNCPFCLPGGPTTMVEVVCSEPVRFTDAAVLVEGQFHASLDDPSGLYYRLTDARAVAP